MDKASKITLIVIILTISLLGIYAYWVIHKQAIIKKTSSEAAQSLITKEGQSAYTDIDGNPIALEDYLGKILIVNSWASWSPFSAQELPILARLGTEYTEQPVQILAINRGEPRTTAAAYLNSLKIKDGLLLVLDPDDRFYLTVEGFTMPETVFYNQAGEVVAHHRGSMNYQQIKNQLEQIIAQTDSSSTD